MQKPKIEQAASPPIAIGVDVGGTFVDVVALSDDGTLRAAKIPSVNRDKIIEEIADRLLGEWDISPASIGRVVHGTTIATNVVLERKGAKIGLLTTAGFTDVIEIGRQTRKDLYRIIAEPETPTFLAPGFLRRGVRERIGPSGDVVEAMDHASLEQSVADLVGLGVEAIAISFLFSFVNPIHEQQAKRFIQQRHPSLAISLSSEVDPAFREYERTCVTAFDAYVKPALERYLASMEVNLGESKIPASLQIMRSRGGVCSSKIARRDPVRLFLSGPAAGVVGAQHIGAMAGFENLVTLDIGGTTSDIALITRGQPLVRTEGALAGYPVRVSMIDVNPVGAGGGSLAWIDSAGGMRVGPQSAGAWPGPACYGRGGTEATVTDASVVLGFLDPPRFANTSSPLDEVAARKAIREGIAKSLGISLEQAALGMHRLANVQMSEGIRQVSIRRGIDPRNFALVAFGGAGPVHATAVAEDMGISTIIVPGTPGVLSAVGLLAAPVEHESSLALMRPLEAASEPALRDAFAGLKEACQELMRSEDVNLSSVVTLYLAEVCYVGQAHYIEVPIDLTETAGLAQKIYKDFSDLHERQNGHHSQNPARIGKVTVLQRALPKSQSVTRVVGASPSSAPPDTARRIWSVITQEQVEARVMPRSALSVGTTFNGPAVIEQSDTTTIVEPGWSGSVDQNGFIILKKG